MGFTVTRPAGEKDIEFHEYARLLRQQDVDLTNVPRVLEPSTGRRWVYVWDTEDEARKFARELKKHTDKAWYVEEVQEPSRGPLGPVIVQLARRSDGALFGLHPLSQALIRSAFPEALGSTSVFFNVQRWNDFLRLKRPLKELGKEMALILTGLTKDQLDELGLELIDTSTHTTLATVPPLSNGQLGA